MYIIYLFIYPGKNLALHSWWPQPALAGQPVTEWKAVDPEQWSDSARADARGKGRQKYYHFTHSAMMIGSTSPSFYVFMSPADKISLIYYGILWV